MKLLLAALMACPSLASTARPNYPPHHAPARAAAPAAAKVYTCNGGSAYAYYSSPSCSGLNRCTHKVKAVTVTVAEGMSRRPCKKCY